MIRARARDKSLDLFFSAIAHDEDYISVTPGKTVINQQHFSFANDR